MNTRRLTANEEADMANKREMYEERICQEFARLGFPEQTQGTMYSKEAVLYMIMNLDRKVGITKDVYPHIARLFSTTTANVERAIRNTIERIWLKRSIQKIVEWYPYKWNENIGRPSNGDFIKNVGHKIICQ